VLETRHAAPAADDVKRPDAASGVWVPAATPFRANLAIDYDRYIAHCQKLLADGGGSFHIARGHRPNDCIETRHKLRERCEPRDPLQGFGGRAHIPHHSGQFRRPCLAEAASAR
jgi:hypothetical protein